MNKYQLSLCGYEKKNQHSKRGRVGGDTHNDCCGNVAFRGTGCRMKPPLLLGERVLPGGGWVQICAGCSFRRMAISADVRPETTGNVAETYLAALLDRVL